MRDIQGGNAMHQFISKLPKAELHVHIEGTFEPELKFRIAKRNGISLPYSTVDECIADYIFTDLPSFLRIYYDGMNVLFTEQDFYDLTYAYLEKAHSQSVVYAEMFFDPQAHTSRGVAFDTVIRGIKRAQDEARAMLGIETQLVLCFLRDMDATSAMETLLQALPYKDWIIGVGLDSDEKGNPPIKFKDVFARARQEGFKLTMHCDVDQENTTEHIRQCLHEIGVERIDHGVNSLDEDKLWQEVRDRRLALTVCPISNSFITGSATSSEIKTMLDRQMMVTVNSDDPAYFRGYINENYEIVQKEANLTANDLYQLARNSFEGSWLPREKKNYFLSLLDAYMASCKAANDQASADQSIGRAGQ
jgi:adenine deaminase